jgi:hypothetical protein
MDLAQQINAALGTAGQHALTGGLSVVLAVLAIVFLRSRAEAKERV